MNRNLFYVMLILGFNNLAKALTNFSYQENLIIETFLKDFEIKHCIIVKEEKMIFRVKKFSNLGIMSMVNSYEDLKEYFKAKMFRYVNTAIVIKDVNLMEIVNVFKKLEKVSKSKKKIFFFNKLKNKNFLNFF